MYIILVLTEHIVEVREKQNSDGFDRYPFEEAEDESFSLLVEGEIQGKLNTKAIKQLSY